MEQIKHKRIETVYIFLDISHLILFFKGNP